MVRFVVTSLVLFAVIISCMGQTFQYSRGWTNGKRSSSHIREDPTIAEIFEIPDSDSRLEKCMIQLQRFIHNPFIIRPAYATGSNSNLFPSANVGSGSNRHQSNEIFEDLPSSEHGEFSTKHN